MNKTAIKNFAIWARVQLIEAAKRKAYEYEITDDGKTKTSIEAINGRILSGAEKEQRRQLIDQIRQKGYTQVMEEAAYTWFNRFIALRFMEVNGYLPSKTRVFTDETGAFKPEILKQAMTVELEGLNRSKVLELLDRQDNEALYKYLLIIQCNALSDCLPYMFERIDNWTELLFPTNLLRADSIIGKMVSMIPAEDWTDQVQIIGWLYQYYNTEPKDKVFADLKKNIKITKENIPAATQLFTPDWIVHYMVENSLGRLWLEGHPNDAMKAEFKYYLDEAEQEPEVEAQLAEIRKEYAALKPEEIKVIDPCCGSGHILCVLFDVLTRIYEDYGYSVRDAAAMIVQNNLWGLDIDERAAQLSYFAVMMKARQYDRRFFTRKVQPHVYAIEESNGITSAPMHDMGLNLTQEEYSEAVKQVMRLVEEMHDAKEYGSIIHVTPCDWDLLRRFAVPRDDDGQMRLDVHGEIEASARLQILINIGEALAQQYHTVVTNPPYMGGSGMSSKLGNYVVKNYSEGKNDLFAVFMQKCNRMAKINYFQAMITQNAWMFLSGFEKLRVFFSSTDIVNMIHLGARAFEEIAGEVVQTTSFVFRRTTIKGYRGQYCRLVDGANQSAKEKMYLNGEERYISSQEDYSKIPGQPIAYWVSKSFANIFDNKTAENYALKICKGGFTGNNDKYLRLWFEVSTETIPRKWNPYSKGGGYRKWYGNSMHLILWENNGFALKHEPKAGVGASKYYGKEHIVWSGISTGLPSFRYDPHEVYFDDVSPSVVFSDTIDWNLLAIFNCKVTQEVLKIVAPTMHFQAGDIKVVPIPRDVKAVDESLVKENVRLAKEDWDSFETSWDFIRHPLVRDCSLIADAFRQWEEECNQRFEEVKKNEELLNQSVISAYGLGKELSPDVDASDVSIRKADLSRDIRSLISFAVGCMFGRYSPDKPGLAYAGGDFDSVFKKDVLTDEHGNRITFGGTSIAVGGEYTQINCDGNWIDVTFSPDKDNIIPICDDDYFDDDIVGRFVDFIRTVYGAESLEQNLRFIADALGGKGTSREVIRNYFLNDFYTDHLKIYQKRPIYWLFSSGKKNGFKALIYMHRYQPDLLARLRTDYVHEQQERYRTQLQMLEESVQSASPSDRVKLNKRIAKLKDQALEIQQYEEKIHHLADQMISIDLDDGVKVNYAKFQDVLEKIK